MLRSILIVSAVSFVASAQAADELKTMTWKVGSDTREARVSVPATKEPHPPLVFIFHGHGGSPEHVVRRLAIHKHWAEAVCVYPKGLPTPAPLIDPQGRWNGWQKFSGDQDDRDLKFYDAMLKTMQDDFHIDEKRVYVTGHSNGGFFAYLLNATRGDTLAAIAPIAGNLNLRDLKAQKPKPVLHVAGEQDAIVKYASQSRSIEEMKRINGCDTEGKSLADGCMLYASKSGTPVITLIHQGGHEIPEKAPARIAEFFKTGK